MKITVSKFFSKNVAFYDHRNEYNKFITHFLSKFVNLFAAAQIHREAFGIAPIYYDLTGSFLIILLVYIDQN